MGSAAKKEESMKLTGLHLLLTYQCNLECDHCFVWGSPRQEGAMTIGTIRRALDEARELGTVGSIFFEGGEPFLYYATLLGGVRAAASLGFKVGIVSNGYWALDTQDALECLEPFRGLVQYLSISTDLYHWEEKIGPRAKSATRAAEELGIPSDLITIAQPEEASDLPRGEAAVRYRGRAAEKLAHRAPGLPWSGFTECPHEDLKEPGRLHLDPFGNLHICQGISVGNMFRVPLGKILGEYDTDSHPITGPLHEGGPAGLVRGYEIEHEETYPDACHLCFEARSKLRPRFGDILGPDQMYGVAPGP